MTCIADEWAGKFGLAPVPLFDVPEFGADRHHVLLDGGYGSFVFSESGERIWRDPAASTWAWSSGVPHHVTVTPTEVAVIRWDRPTAEEFSRRSVETGLDAFYAFLVADRVRSTRRVVDHLLDVFRRTRSLIRDANVEDDKAVQAYLGVLAAGISRAVPGKKIPVPDAELLNKLPVGAVEVLVEQVMLGDRSSRVTSSPTLRPDLAIRHAGSEIFQEAHFSLTSGGQPDMFDWVAPAVAHRSTRGTSHFTPPALARSLTEQVLDQFGDMSQVESFSILDPACGSGSFLYEAIRTLRRLGFQGSLTIIGRDVSPAAVDMARFTLAFAAADWRPNGGMMVDVSVADALQGHLPKVDAVLMNPPFQSWTAMSAVDRDRLKGILGSSAKGRLDLSMAFVTRGLAALKAGGVIGAVMPTSVLSSSAAESWRKSTADSADLVSLASLGEYGLFTHALVTVATVIMRKHGAAGAQSNETLVVIGGKTAEATGNALRAIRRHDSLGPPIATQEDWEIFHVPAEQFKSAPTWRPMSPAIAAAVERLTALGVTRPVGELFQVLQGVRTGWVKGFVLSSTEFRELPKVERQWFRPAAMGDNIIGGNIKESDWVFYPYDESGLLLKTENDVRRALPMYYDRWLEPNKGMLANRMTHAEGNRSDWWGLARPRSWGTSHAPRIVSKYFGGVGGFVLDTHGRFVVVQGFAWFLNSVEPGLAGPASLTVLEEELLGQIIEEEFGLAGSVAENAGMPTTELLSAYVALFNSISFERLLAAYSSHVSGGQYDLSWRYTRHIPVPDFAALWTSEGRSSEVARLAELGRIPRPDLAIWSSEVDRLCRSFYGADLLDRL